MNPQRILEDSIERMDVWCSKHPTGVLTLSGHGARLRVVPTAEGWALKKVDTFGRVASIGDYRTEDVQKLVHRILTWTWKHPIEEDA